MSVTRMPSCWAPGLPPRPAQPGVTQLQSRFLDHALTVLTTDGFQAFSYLAWLASDPDASRSATPAALAAFKRISAKRATAAYTELVHHGLLKIAADGYVIADEFGYFA